MPPLGGAPAPRPTAAGCVATAATHQLGKEADIFKAVVWHSIVLATIVGLLTLLQAYVPPFTRLVPHP